MTASARSRQRSLQTRESTIYSRWMGALKIDQIPLTKERGQVSINDTDTDTSGIGREGISTRGRGRGRVARVRSALGEIADAKLVYIIGRLVDYAQYVDTSHANKQSPTLCAVCAVCAVISRYSVQKFLRCFRSQVLML